MAAPTATEHAPAPSLPRTVRRRRAALLLLIAATVLTAGGTWLFYGSSWLRVTRVKVTGTQVLTPAQVKAAAAVPLGGPLVSADTGAIEGRLVKRLSRIESVDISRSWPHTIELKVTERTPAAIVENDGKFIEVDADGLRFATVETAPRGVPLVELTPVQGASYRHFGTKQLLKSAVEVAEDLPDAVRRQALVIRVRSYDGIAIRLTGGRTVVWGSAENGEEKAVALTALMKAAKGADHFDVSAPTSPAASSS
ncbi:cell division protein FtsQ/DivIB [Streptomyces sp. NBC_01262]|uniref:cell division protein FtsQ/DivIB n=1 Tax=Streptomyces sp. NBC_01262 TaxID=2903803 RepID=UPI002E351AFE|nr:FtsQ-type POTRA domain-containing protein [Streptomyces sp. NBC_01262]